MVMYGHKWSFMVVYGHAELEMLPLSSSGKILTPLGFLTKACGFKTGKLINKEANYDIFFSLVVVVLMLVFRR